MAKKPNKRVSASEKEYKKLSKKAEQDAKKAIENVSDELNGKTEISNSSRPKSKGRKSPKENKKMSTPKSVKDMTREELIKSATSTAQHANKTIRDFEKADKGHFHTPGNLLSIAEKYDIKTKGNRVSRSFGKLNDNQLRDFIVEVKRAYTGKTVKKATEEANRKRINAIGTLKDRFEGLDISKLEGLSDEEIGKIFGELKSKMSTKEWKDITSDLVLLNILTEMGLLDEDDNEDLVYAFQREREVKERLDRNKVKNRNRGRKR